ncbi:MAG: hypothetical protein VX723_00035 [Candidatus Thermoplasmatota archaeon]|nr:hypothetical protein [Candidatus Thermoplasmatota archaeon]
MYSVGLTPDQNEERSELFGNLSLVGSGGKFVAVLTRRQLTLERFDGHGVRLSLGSISRMRHMKVPLFPAGAVPLSLMAIYLGLKVLLPPYALVATTAGSLTLLGYLLSRTSVLAIETEAGDRHIVAGSEGVLLRLCMMVDRVGRGISIEEARKGLEHIDAELPTFPAFRDAMGDTLEPRGLLEAPNHTELDTFTDSLLLIPTEPESSPMTGFLSVEEPSEPMPSFANDAYVSPFPSHEDSPPMIFDEQLVPGPEPDAYARAWGKEESPSWYEEKTPEDSRIDSALGDAVGGMGLFGEGGIFDTEPTSSYSPPTTPSPREVPTSADLPSTQNYINAVGTSVEERGPTSSQMIRRAQDRFGDVGPYMTRSLPAPSEAAVREECKPGVVRQAKARQALLFDAGATAPALDSASLEEFPGVSRIVSSMGTGRVNSGGRRKASKRRLGWIGALLGPNHRASRRYESYSSEYGDPDGTVEASEARFQSSQHIRLRSDQDHQADVVSRVTKTSIQPHSAKEALDGVVKRVSSGQEREYPATETENEERGLRFSQLRRTSSKSEPHPLPGIKRLE